MIDGGIVWRDYLGITPSGAVGVVIATIVLYLFFTLLVHVAGPRLMAAPRVTSFVVLAVVGGVSARSMLGESPTMLGALIALNTLMAMEALMGSIQRTTRTLAPTIHQHPSVVMIQGRPVAEALRRRSLAEGELADRLRVAGVLDLHDAALVILENRGSLTVMRRGERIQRELLEGVRGAELVPEALLVEDEEG